MGCMSSKVDPEDKEASKINANIDKQIRTDKKIYDRTVKILLLGMYCLRIEFLDLPLTSSQGPESRGSPPSSSKCESSTRAGFRKMSVSKLALSSIQIWWWHSKCWWILWRHRRLSMKKRKVGYVAMIEKETLHITVSNYFPGTGTAAIENGCRCRCR